MVADMGELVNDGQPAKPDLITQYTMASDIGPIGGNALVSDHTIMGDVRERHEITIGPDPCFLPMFS